MLGERRETVSYEAGGISEKGLGKHAEESGLHPEGGREP